MEERQENTRPPTPAHSPTPWRVTTNPFECENCIIDANGKDVAECSGGRCRTVECAEADAELICDAVNAHGEVERLRKDYAEMDVIAANLQQSRSKIIEDNDRLRDALRDIKTFAAEIFRTARSAAIKADADEIHGLCRSALGEEAGDE